MDPPDSKKATGDGKTIIFNELFDSGLFEFAQNGADRTGSEQSDGEVIDPVPLASFNSNAYPHWLRPVPNSDTDPPKPLAKSPEFVRNSLETLCSTLFDVHNSWELPSLRSGEVESYPFLSVLNSGSQRHRPPNAGAGLENLGNTCYLNAVLQCFIHTVPFVSGILSDTHSAQCNGNNERFCLLCTVHELVKLSFNSRNGVISPWKLVNNLSSFSNFQRSQQEDAHEFLQSLLSNLDSCCEPMENNGDIVKQVFGGRVVSKVKCCKCGHISDTLEPSIDQSLEIEDANTLIEALQSFTKVEKIEDPEAMFTCEACKDKVFVEKQLAFDMVPQVAAFHLKRFKTNGLVIQKIDKHVVFPLELNLLPFTASAKTDDVELKYVLHAVIVHAGLSFSSGHYYCFVRLSPDTWCKFDDSSVIGVHEIDVLSQEAYILFYGKEGTTWFSSFIETQKLCEDPTLTLGVSSPDSVLRIGPSTSTSTNLHSFFSGESNEPSVGTGDKDNLLGLSISCDFFTHKQQAEFSSDMICEVIQSGVGSDTNIAKTATSPTSAQINGGGGGCKRRLEKRSDDMETNEKGSDSKECITRRSSM